MALIGCERCGRTSANYTLYTTTMGSESASHTTEDLFFLKNTMILGKNWESGDLFSSHDFAFIY